MPGELRVRTAWALWAAIPAIGLIAGCGGTRTTEDPPDGSSHAVVSPAPAGASEAGAAEAREAAEAVRKVVGGFRRPDPQAIWDALPPGHQDDVNGLFREFGRKMDPELWDRLRTLAGRLAVLLGERRDWFLSYPPLRDDPLVAAGPLKQLAGNWHVTVGLLEALAAADLDTLRTFDGRAVFAGFDRDHLDRLRQLALLLPEDNPFSLLDELLDGAEVRPVEAAAGEGRAGIEIVPRGGEPQPFEFVRVEGRWFPAAWQGTWADEVAAARGKLDAELAPEVLAAKKQSLLPGLARFEESLDRLSAASDAPAFYDLLDRELLPVLSGTPPEPEIAAPRPAPGPPGGRVTVEFTRRLDDRTADAVSQALLEICDGPDAIVVPRGGGAATRFEVSPAGNVRAFAQRIRFARVTAIDAERRVVTVELLPAQE